MKRAATVFAAFGVSIFFVVAGCNGVTINTPTRVFDGPSDVALACRQVHADPRNGLFVFDAHPIDHCTPEEINKRTPHDPVTGAELFTSNNYSEAPVLAALVSQSARGELALVDVSTEHVVDLQEPVPGFGFVPVGSFPEHVRVSGDGCLAVTSNSDSCDLAVLDLPTLYNMSFLPFRSPAPDPHFADEVVRRLTPTINGRALGARPKWIEFSPYTTPAQAGWETNDAIGKCIPRTGMTQTSYRAWVAMPGCSLVAEVDISAATANANGFTPAEVLRALRFTPTGVEEVTGADLGSLTCPAECAGEPFIDGTAGSVPDGGTSLVATQSQPTTVAIDVENGVGRLFVGDRASERITIIPFDVQSGALGTPRQLTLDSRPIGVSVVRISPRSESGKFLYAVARDASVRVIDLDREAECETNPDPREFQNIPSPAPTDRVRQFGCFPLGDPNTPRRAPLATGPGISLPGLALPKDVAFVHTDAPPPVAAGLAPPAAGPATLVGDYAWIISSDGRATVVNIFDACPAPNIPQLVGSNYTPACSPDAVDASRSLSYQNNFGHPLPMDLDRVSHRLRSGSSRFFQPTNQADNVGQPRLTDVANPYQVFVNGIPKAAVTDGPGALPALVSDSYPAVAFGPLPSVAPVDPRFMTFFDPDRVRNETWTLAWEGTIPGSHRTLGAPIFRVPGTNQALANPILLDNGAAPCSLGVLKGDKLEFTGCSVDSDCGYLDYCVRDSAAPSDITSGMCLPQSTAQQLQITCKNLLRAPRRYRILSPKQQAVIDSSLEPTGKSDLFELGEIYEPEHPVETHTCQSSADCSDIKVLDAAGVTTLDTTCLQDADGVHRCLRACNPNAQDADLACGHDFQCLPSRFGDGRCVLAPLDETLFKACMSELQTYEVHAGEEFLFGGSASGVLVDLQVDPATNECEIPPQSNEFVRLHQSRIPIEPAAMCPASFSADPLAGLPADFIDPVSGLPTNACQVTPAVSPPPVTSVARLIHVETPTFSFLLQTIAGPPGTAPSPSPQPITVPPDLFTLQFQLVGSGFPLGVALAIDVQAQQPSAVVTAPDRQTIFVVDEGKQSAGVGLRGQLLKVSSENVAVDRSFQVR
jgi:hypothetical protein